MSPKRRILNRYTDACRQIELAHQCIRTLEGMRGATVKRCIEALKKEQQRALKQIDKEAAALGAPYPGSAQEGADR